MTLVKNKAFTIAGTLKVGSADDSVTFKNVVITVAAASDLVLTGDGIVTLAGAQADSIKINNGGRITTKNAGVLTVDFTTIVGDWGVTGGSGTVTITATGEGVTTINGSALASALTAMAPDSSITQAKGSGNSLTLTATTTIDLKGIAGSPVGAILLETGTDPGCLTFAGGNGVIKTANTGTASSVTPGTALGIATSTATGKLLVSAANGITVKTNPDTNLVSITGATANTTLKGHTTAEASTPIDADLVVTAS